MRFTGSVKRETEYSNGCEEEEKVEEDVEAVPGGGVAAADVFAVDASSSVRFAFAEVSLKGDSCPFWLLERRFSETSIELVGLATAASGEVVEHSENENALLADDSLRPPDKCEDPTSSITEDVSSEEAPWPDSYIELLC